MPLSHAHIRTTVETYLSHHPHERPQLGGLLDALDRPTDLANRSPFSTHVTCGAIVVDPLGQCPPQLAGIDVSTGHRGVEPSMAPAVLTHQRQLGRRPHRPVAAQDGISQLEQRVRTSGRTGIELTAEA